MSVGDPAEPNLDKPLPPLKLVMESWRHSTPYSIVSIAESAMPPPLQPRKPPRAFRSSISRTPLTPSDMPYPAGLLRVNSMIDLTKAEQMLGLRKPPQSSCTPLAQIYTVLGESSDSLPKHKLDMSKDRDEPLNGRTAWLHSLTGALIVFNCWGMANAFGLFQAYFERYYLPPGTSPSSISWIGSTQLALVFGLGVPVGRLVDQGYFRFVFHSGSVIMLLGIFCTAWCKTLWSLWLVQGLMTGLGMGMVFCAGIVALMTWFDERKLGAAMAVGAAGSCIGGIVYIVVARHFLLTHGFPTTMRVLGAISAAALIPPNLVFRVRGQRNKLKARRQHATSSNIMLGFVSPAYLLAAAGMFFAFLGVYFGFVYMVSFASTELKLSDDASINLLIYMLAANLPGRFLPALISDKCIGPLNTILPSIFLSAGCIALWMALGDSGNERGPLTVVACFYGFVSAGVQVLYAPTVYTFCLDSAPKSDFPPTTSEREATSDSYGPHGHESRCDLLRDWPGVSDRNAHRRCTGQVPDCERDGTALSGCSASGLVQLHQARAILANICLIEASAFLSSSSSYVAMRSFGVDEGSGSSDVSDSSGFLVPSTETDFLFVPDRLDGNSAEDLASMVWSWWRPPSDS
ncbi:hypothetical protein LTR35_011201 [Friedmanniomyces endolithicus]|nr:hypothetical protein LTR35_011201 [Friedmanniomyces endolithicus]KAK0287105.1 hypothetical protein LTS00_010143 [Friedmanniomyces endolithicus]KAK0994218.1 hypothetical protein LTR54_010893 [Friedmanniomyces endolithicus]